MYSTFEERRDRQKTMYFLLFCLLVTFQRGTHNQRSKKKSCNTKELCGTSPTSCNATCKLYHHLDLMQSMTTYPEPFRELHLNFDIFFFFFYLCLNVQTEMVSTNKHIQYSRLMLKAEVVFTCDDMKVKCNGGDSCYIPESQNTN